MMCEEDPSLTCRAMRKMRPTRKVRITVDIPATEAATLEYLSMMPMLAQMTMKRSNRFHPSLKYSFPRPVIYNRKEYTRDT
jgi:hypothetical protein